MQMKFLPYLVGQRVHRLVILRYSGVDCRGNNTFECRCDCGNTVVATASSLNKWRQSCGCAQLEKATAQMRAIHKQQVTHGMTGTLTYQSWKAAMDRCYDHKKEIFARYGAVGICMCLSLRATPKNLVSLIGHRTSKGLTLDRINGKGSYTCGKCSECLEKKWPLNVRWASATQQARNRKNNVWIVINGERKTRGEWAEQLGISYRKAVYELAKYEMKTVEFTPPEGFTAPETDGKDFELVCTFRQKPDGKICLIQLGDMEMPGYYDKDGVGEKPDMNQYVGGMMNQGGSDES